MIEPHIYQALGLTDSDYQQIETILGREPTKTELAMFSVEWSEHCGYRRSKKYLKKLPRTGKYETLIGEDAGGILVDGLAIIFKMESHNHPSQVEPKQGAATGIGGILRDIFTSGARPIALLDSLRFGELTDPYSRYLFQGVVDGIQFYGNCVGVPTVGGEIYFDKSYAGNCLVNVMCLGVCKKERIARARASGTGNPIMYVGSSTGRDGIGGCSVLASAEFKEGEEKRPTVQIGDPFTEKCLIEATLEALATGDIVGIKDMGAAGLTCSTSEMAAVGEVGMEIDLSLVPRREEGMTPWEVMMSESQERMLVCVRKGAEEKIANIFRKWNLNAQIIGRVTEDKRLIIRDNKKIVAELDTKTLTNPPLLDLPDVEPDYIKEVRKFDVSSLPEPKDYNEVLLKLLSSPNIANKAWVYEQYDHMVRTNTVVGPGSDAAVLRIKGTNIGIALTTDCNSRYCYLNPFIGAQIAVAEAARNLVCSGADPAAITDCLNFANPDKPDRYWQFKQCVEGIAEACTALNIPVVSGNVSFYNESPQGPIFPTPTIGMIGILGDIKQATSAWFKNEGDIILLLGETKQELGGSEYLKVIHQQIKGDVPQIDLDLEKRIQSTVLTAIQNGLVNSAHDLSEGGLAVALAECSISNQDKKLGAEITLPMAKIRLDALLFGETQSRIILSVHPDNVGKIEEICDKNNVPVYLLGKVGGRRLKIDKLINLGVDDLSKAWREAIPYSCTNPVITT